ncbi:MAG: hypothetical protein LUH07_01325, partial [Lachnospiraceae bacterium]|nr:hypothetical protein [Lachnospiraceae bacterium]
ELDQGNDVDTIYLKKIDILYGGEMVYYEGFEFMKPWIDSYYELPDTISYVYTDTGDPIGNNLETCNVINGYWSDGWVSSNAEIEIATGDEGLLHIEGWIPDSEELNVITEKWIIITCNGEVSECEIKENSYSIFSIDVQTEKNEIINVVIETNFAFCPGGEDTREVSFVLNVLEGE